MIAFRNLHPFPSLLARTLLTTLTIVNFGVDCVLLSYTPKPECAWRLSRSRGARDVSLYLVTASHPGALSFGRHHKISSGTKSRVVGQFGFFAAWVRTSRASTNWTIS
jgi:hypothetical protein